MSNPASRAVKASFNKKIAMHHYLRISLFIFASFFFILHSIRADNDHQFTALCQSSTSTRCLRVATWNVARLGFFKKGKSTKEKRRESSRITQMAAIIRQRNIDLIALQEVSDPAALELLRKKLSRLEKWRSVYLSADKPGYRNLAQAILYKDSRWSLHKKKIIRDKNFFSPSIWRRLRYPLAIQMQIKKKGGILDFYVVHWKAKADQRSCRLRRQQISEFYRFLEVRKKSASPYFVVLGDFNDILEGLGLCAPYGFDSVGIFENDSDYFFISQKKYRDPRAVSFLNPRYLSFIDHLLVPSRMKKNISLIAKNQLVKVFSHQNLKISDHQLVYFWLDRQCCLLD